MKQSDKVDFFFFLKQFWKGKNQGKGTDIDFRPIKRKQKFLIFVSYIIKNCPE